MNYSLQNSLGFLIYFADLKMRNLLQRRIKSFGLGTEQWAILNQLCEQDGINQKELAEKTYKDQTSLTRILDKLAKKGYVERVASPEDRRAFLVNITEKGRELRDELIPLDQAALEEAEKVLTEKEVKMLKDLLRKLATGIK